MPNITFDAAGTELRAYLAVPDGDGPFPGVVVLHEGVVGLNDDMRKQSDRFAEQGYVALAPDFYSTGPRMMCMQSTMRDMLSARGKSFEYIEAARRWLADREDATGRVAVAGFCQGGGFAVVAAARFDFAAAAVNYGSLPSNVVKELEGACPIVASYGKRDLSLLGCANKLESTLAELGVPHDVKEYSDAGHGFLSEWSAPGPLSIAMKVSPMAYGVGRQHLDDGWARIFAFFDEHVKG
ncbi:dienelactone hydrolase family protein [Antrihabitans sp. YC2-6]|uniref:dienelactone hydrolase family protein n=1 Tax=Antrihabitans sp. YC2-6 TaxID=2799498 RepID=UPI0018F77601|nr:dienelactone hydrolase family protein [Antrihabitans sp. YC2-6]MBJ8343345.1 dienelactone hydrolase family protein [Antrihabitans sp. YC2-6]